jgi:WD40 repeat protein
MPDEKMLASSGADGAIKLWDAGTGELVRSFVGHSKEVWGIAISPDGKTLLSGDVDGNEWLWDLQTGERTKSFKFGTSTVRRVAFSRDGAYFLTSRWDGSVRIRETASGRLRTVLPGGTDCADMTRDNHLVVTSGNGTTAQLFVVNLSKPTPDDEKRIAALLGKLTDDSYDVREKADAELGAIGMLAEPQLLAAMDDKDAEVRVRARRLRQQALAPKPVADLRGHRGDVEVVCFSPDGRMIATACRGGDIKVWNAADYTLITTLTLAAAEGGEK